MVATPGSEDSQDLNIKSLLDLLRLKEWIWDLKFWFRKVPLEKLRGILSDDVLLRRWLCNFDSPFKAAIKILSNMKWREAHNVDTILEGAFLERFGTIFPIHFGSIDNAGRPVVYIPLHHWRLDKIPELAQSGDYLRFIISFFEHVMRECGKVHSGQCSEVDAQKFIVIVNMGDVSARTLLKHEVFGRISLFLRILEEHYPATLLRCIVINCGSSFIKTIFRFVLSRPYLIFERKCLTPSLLKIYVQWQDYKWNSLLRSFIPSEELPVECGGWKLMSEDVVDTNSLHLSSQ